MKTNLNLLVASAACAALVACAGSGSAPVISADTILTNAKIVTVDANSTVARAVAIKDGKFLRVGLPADVLRHRGPNTKVFDLSGQTIIPGLTDSHFHHAGGGPGVDLSRARSLADLSAAVSAAAGKAAAGTVVISNSDWHEAQLAQQRLPTAEELEVAAPGVPVVLVRGGHSYFLNNTALARYGITTSTVVPAGGVIARNAQGRLTGEVTSNAKSLVTLPPTPAVTTADLDAQQRVMNSYGVTAVTMPGITTATYAQLKELRDTGKATVRYNVMFRTANPAAVTALGTAGIKPGEGDEWVKVWTRDS